MRFSSENHTLFSAVQRDCFTKKEDTYGNKRSDPARQPSPKICSAAVCRHGTITARRYPAQPPVAGFRRPKAIRKRSRIIKFSRKSAAGLRKLLVQACGPEGWVCFGATLTVPGPPISPEEWRRIWVAFRQRVRRYERLAIIWRIEMQEREQPHIHCVCWGRTGPGRLRELWDDAMGDCSAPAKVRPKSNTRARERAARTIALLRRDGPGRPADGFGRGRTNTP